MFPSSPKRPLHAAAASSRARRTSSTAASTSRSSACTATSSRPMPETQLMLRIPSAPRLARHGRVVRVVGLVIEAVGVEMGVGDLCRLSTIGENTSLLAECVGFRDGGVLLMPYGELGGLHAGAMVEPL